MSAGAAMLLLM